MDHQHSLQPGAKCGHTRPAGLLRPPAAKRRSLIPQAASTVTRVEERGASSSEPSRRGQLGVVMRDLDWPGNGRARVTVDHASPDRQQSTLSYIEEQPRQNSQRQGAQQDTGALSGQLVLLALSLASPGSQGCALQSAATAQYEAAVGQAPATALCEAATGSAPAALPRCMTSASPAATATGSATGSATALSSRQSGRSWQTSRPAVGPCSRRHACCRRTLTWWQLAQRFQVCTCAAVSHCLS